jgi:hypothetical protein
MDIPISIETVVLYGSVTDPRLKDSAKKLEDQGRIVEVHPFPPLDGRLCYCNQVSLRPHSNKNLPPLLKSEEEIQKAHDAIATIVLGEVDFGYPSGALQAAHHCLDVLCWILNHDHNPAFGDNLTMIFQEAERRGCKLTTTKPFFTKPF